MFVVGIDSAVEVLEERKDPLPDKENCPLLTEKELKSANTKVKDCLKRESSKTRTPTTRGKYNGYKPEQRAQIGKYTAENGPTRAAKHFSKLMSKNIPEPTAKRLKTEYLSKLRALQEVQDVNDETPLTVKNLPTKEQGRPLLLGQALDKAVQDYVTSMRNVEGVVNTAIVMAAAEGIIAARDRSLLIQHGGHIEIKKSWAKSLLGRMGYVKR